MAIAWLTALKIIPWADVISNAPMVADGARKLWKAVGKRPVPQDDLSDGAHASISSEGQAMAQLRGRVDALEATASELHSQMLASTELIKALAEQNTQLVNQLQINRIRFRWLTAATLVAAITAVCTVVFLVAR